MAHFTDEQLEALRQRIAGGMSGGFYPDDAYAVIDEVVEDLIEARAKLHEIDQSGLDG
jgi:hypothetical protein